MGRRRDDSAWPALAAVARRRHGVFTVAEAVAAGYSAAQVRERLAAEVWTRVVGEALVRQGTELTAAVVASAAVAAVPGAAGSHLSAARLTGLPVPGAPLLPVHLVVAA